MEGEANNFIKVCLSVLLSLCYCYAIGKIVPRGRRRLLCVLPIVCIFLLLPLNLHSVHLGVITAFFIAWLANFKLLLFALGKGPLSSHPSISLGRFMFVACFPIKVRQNAPNLEKPRNTNAQLSYLDGENKDNLTSKRSPLKYAIMGVLLGILIRVYEYSDHIHPTIVLLLHCSHIYLFFEIILAVVGALARALLGVDLEPHFNEPYLSTSLEDFWGRRWNLMVTDILRLTVYDATHHATARVIGPKWAHLPAIFANFVVLGLVHELIFYYLGRVRPTWEVTCFFLLHGLCLTVEVVLKKAFFTGRWQLPPLISGPLTVGFFMVTYIWLFLPQFIRCKADERAIEEYAAFGEFVKSITRAFVF